MLPWRKCFMSFSLSLLRKLCNCCKGRRNPWQTSSKTRRNAQERSWGVNIETKPLVHWKSKVNGCCELYSASCRLKVDGTSFQVFWICKLWKERTKSQLNVITMRRKHPNNKNIGSPGLFSCKSLREFNNFHARYRVVQNLDFIWLASGGRDDPSHYDVTAKEARKCTNFRKWRRRLWLNQLF